MFFQSWPLIIGVLLLCVLLYKVWDVLAPPVLGLLALYLLSPYRRNRLVVRIMIVTALVLTLWLVIDTGRIVIPFVIAFILAYLFNPVVSWMERWRIPRALSTALILFILAGLTVLAGRFFIPRILDQLTDLVVRLPESISRLMAWVEEGPVLGYLANVLDLGDVDNLRVALFEELARQGQNIIQQAFRTLVNIVREIPTVFGTLSRALEMIAVPFVAFFLLKDFDVMKGYAKSLVPPRSLKRVTEVVCDIDAIISRYMRGQLIVAVIVGVSTGLVLWLIGIDYALILGLTTGVLNVIPYFGFIVSLGLGILVAFFDPEPLITVLKLIVIYIALNAIESSLISPRIVGRQVGLHPVWVILSLLLFFHFFGFWGLVIAVPITAVGRLFVRKGYHWYLDSPLYNRK